MRGGAGRFVVTLAAGAGLAMLAHASPARWVERLERASHFEDRWNTAQLARGREGGLRWLEIRTPGDGRPVFVARAKPYARPLDLRRRFVRAWLWVDDPSRLAGVELRLSSDGFRSSFFAVEVPLFADPEFGILQPGVWEPVTFGFGGARRHGDPDRARIDSIGWYLEDRGRGPVTLRWGGLEVVEAPIEGVLSFTFDDGYRDQLTAAAPLLARRGFRATAYVMPDQIGSPGYLSEADLRTLHDRYGWQIAAHHAVPFTKMEPERLDRVLLGVRRFLRLRGFGAGSDDLAYPLGKHDPWRVLPLARKYFRSARLASGGPETLPPADPFALRALNVLDTTSPEQVEAWARRARHEGEWAILMLHHIVPRPEHDTDYSVEAFRRVVDRVAASGVRVMTVEEVWQALATGALTAAPAGAAPRAPVSPSRRR